MGVCLKLISDIEKNQFIEVMIRKDFLMIGKNCSKAGL